MSRARVLVGTRKGAFILTADGTRKDWEVSGPHFGGWEIYHVKGSPADPERLYASQTSGWFGQILQRIQAGQPAVRDLAPLYREGLRRRQGGQCPLAEGLAWSRTHREPGASCRQPDFVSGRCRIPARERFSNRSSFSALHFMQNSL